jgi:hemoglobin
MHDTARDGRMTETEIRTMVETFYDRVRADAALGPIFEPRIGDDWQAHMDRMVDFWSSVLLATGRFRGNPLATHRAIAELRSHHFDRWLELFEEVLREVLPEHKAADVLGRARRMRMVLDRPSEHEVSTPDASPDISNRLPGISTTRATR